MAKPSFIVRCPVCARRVSTQGTPRRCFRCDTLHHNSCWEYLPGCAVLGCSESSELRTDGWVRLHRLLRARLWAVRLALWCAYLVLAALVAGVYYHPWWPQAYEVFRGAAGLAALSLLMAAALTGQMQGGGAAPIPPDPPGDPRTRLTLAFRELGRLPRRPWRAGCLSGLLPAAFLLGIAVRESGWTKVWAGLRQGGPMLLQALSTLLETTLAGDPRALAGVLLLAIGPLAPLTVFVLVALLVRLTAGWVARQQLLVNRLAVSAMAVRRVQEPEDDDEATEDGTP